MFSRHLFLSVCDCWEGSEGRGSAATWVTEISAGRENRFDGYRYNCAIQFILIITTVNIFNVLWVGGQDNVDSYERPLKTDVLIVRCCIYKISKLCGEDWGPSVSSLLFTLTSLSVIATSR